MAARRRSPPVRTFQVESISSLPASEHEADDVIDGDDVEYAPEVVEQVLKAAEGPLIVAGTVEEACRILGIADDE